MSNQTSTENKGGQPSNLENKALKPDAENKAAESRTDEAAESVKDPKTAATKSASAGDVAVTLSHYVTIDGKDYAPGDGAKFPADQARHLAEVGLVRLDG